MDLARLKAQIALEEEEGEEKKEYDPYYDDNSTPKRSVSDEFWNVLDTSLGLKPCDYTFPELVEIRKAKCKDQQKHALRYINLDKILKKDVCNDPWDKEGYDSKEIERQDHIFDIGHLSEFLISQGKKKEDPFRWSTQCKKSSNVLNAPELKSSKIMPSYYKELSLQNRDIKVMDRKLARDFHRLKELHLDGNYIRKIVNLPLNLKILSIGCNRLTYVGTKYYDEDDDHVNINIKRRINQYNGLNPDLERRKPHLSLEALVTTGNEIHDVKYLAPCYPNLKVLDLSYNNLCNLEELLNCLKRLPNLSSLDVKGNPLALLRVTRVKCITSCNVEKIKVVDGIEVSQGELEATIDPPLVDLKAKVISQWRGVKQESFKREYEEAGGDAGHSEVERELFLRRLAVSKIVNLFKNTKARQMARLYKMLLNNNNGNFLTLRVSLQDWHLSTPKFNNNLEEPKGDSSSKAKGGGKQGKDKKNDTVPTADSGISIVKEFIRFIIAIPSDVPQGYTIPYQEIKEGSFDDGESKLDDCGPLSFQKNVDSVKQFNLPLSKEVRDLIQYRGVSVEVWLKRVIIKKQTNEDSGKEEEVEEQNEMKIQTIDIPLNNFLNPQTMYWSRGTPQENAKATFIVPGKTTLLKDAKAGLNERRGSYLPNHNGLHSGLTPRQTEGERNGTVSLKIQLNCDELQPN